MRSLSREVQFELRDAINDKLVWSKEFKKEAPQFFFDDYSGRLIFYWDLGSEAGKARLKEDPALVERARQMGNKDDDYLVEVFDAFAGKSVGVLLLETGKGSFDIESGFSEGNWLVLHDDNNRVLVYSIKDGELRHRFFGANAAMNPSRKPGDRGELSRRAHALRSGHGQYAGASCVSRPAPRLCGLVWTARSCLC